MSNSSNYRILQKGKQQGKLSNLTPNKICVLRSPGETSVPIQSIMRGLASSPAVPVAMETTTPLAHTHTLQPQHLSVSTGHRSAPLWRKGTDLKELHSTSRIVNTETVQLNSSTLYLKYHGIIPMFYTQKTQQGSDMANYVGRAAVFGFTQSWG